MTVQLYHARLAFGEILERETAEPFIEAGNLLRAVFEEIDHAQFIVRGFDLMANAFIWEIRALVKSALTLETDSLRASVRLGETKPISHLRLTFKMTRPHSHWPVSEAAKRLERIGVPGPIFTNAASGAPICNLSPSPRTPLTKIEAIG